MTPSYQAIPGNMRSFHCLRGTRQNPYPGHPSPSALCSCITRVLSARCGHSSPKRSNQSAHDTASARHRKRSALGNRCRQHQLSSEAPPPACPLAALARFSAPGLRTSVPPQPLPRWQCTRPNARSLSVDPLCSTEGLGPTLAGQAETLPSGQPRQVHEGSTPPGGKVSRPQRRAPRPREGGPAQAKVGQVLNARPVSLEPTGRAGASRPVWIPETPRGRGAKRVAR